MIKNKVIQIQLFIFVLFLIAINDSYSQNCQDVKEFKSYFSIYKKTTTSFSSTSLKELCRRIFENVNEDVVSCEPKDLIRINNQKTYVIEYGFPQGGYTSSFLLTAFDNDCKNKGLAVIGANALDMSGGLSSTYRVLNDSVIESHFFEEWEDETEEDQANRDDYQYTVVGKDSLYRVVKSVPSTYRKFPIASTRVLTIDELQPYSKQDLDIMRNEIFADHSYRFKTEKWKNYFDTIMQYIPHYNNVNDKLTVIERINIQRILKVAPIK